MQQSGGQESEKKLTTNRPEAERLTAGHLLLSFSINRYLAN